MKEFCYFADILLTAYSHWILYILLDITDLKCILMLPSWMDLEKPLQS